MTIVDMLGQSLILTGLGMAVVFSFLIVMILCMYGSSALIRALKLDKKGKKTEEGAGAKTSAQDNEAVVAAIAAAVHDKQLH